MALLAGVAFAGLLGWRLAGRVDAASVAGLLFVGLAAAAAARPRVALMGLWALLVAIGELRRWVEFQSGTSGQDPLLLVAPALVAALFAGMVLQKQARPTTRGAKLVTALMTLMVLHAANPIQGGPMVGFAGLLFYFVPLVWFWLGRRFGNEDTTVAAVAVLVVLSSVAAGVGLNQVFNGFWAHQSAWLERAGYTALDVGGKTRPFSTLTSSAEYAHLLGLTAAAALAVVIRGRAAPLILAVPVLFFAMFLQGSRGPVVLSALAVSVLFAVRKGRPIQWVVRGVVGVAVLVGVANFGLGHLAEGTAPEAVTPLIQHQTQGLLNPLDQEHSTLAIHAGMASYGLQEALRNPLGRGTGATTLAARKFGGNKVNAEFDVANLAIGLGIAGAAIYLLLIANVFSNLWRLWRGQRSVTALVTAGVLLATVGQWLNGGMYSVAAVVWFLIGTCDRLAEQQRANASASTAGGEA